VAFLRFQHTRAGHMSNFFWGGIRCSLPIPKSPTISLTNMSERSKISQELIPKLRENADISTEKAVYMGLGMASAFSYAKEYFEKRHYLFYVGISSYKGSFFRVPRRIDDGQWPSRRICPYFLEFYCEEDFYEKEQGWKEQSEGFISCYLVELSSNRHIVFGDSAIFYW